MSLGFDRDQVWPRPPTIRFIERLSQRLYNPLEAIAFIGIGNEKLIEPEYAAIRRCFETLMPKAEFNPFLDANIKEDLATRSCVTHWQLCLLMDPRPRDSFLMPPRPVSNHHESHTSMSFFYRVSTRTMAHDPSSRPKGGPRRALGAAFSDWGEAILGAIAAVIVFSFAVRRRRNL